MTIRVDNAGNGSLRLTKGYTSIFTSTWVDNAGPDHLLIPLSEARPLAAELLEIEGKGHIGYTLACPLCFEGLITIQYDPGYPQRNYMPNGDPGYPGEPASIEGVTGTCGCWTQGRLDAVFNGDEPHPVMLLLERLIETMVGIGDYYAAEAEAEFFARQEQDDMSIEAMDAAIDFQIAEQRQREEEIVDAAIDAAIHETIKAQRRSATEPREYCANCGADTTDEPVGPCRACSGRA